jgi:hypothetical protein
VTFDGDVKLIDFGVAKAAGRLTTTQGGALKGKYAYMSPEQVDGEEIDNRSDIFSLGIVLWELLTGSRLFKRDSDVKTMRAVSDCEVIPPSVKNPLVPPALDPIVEKALAQNRSKRYQTMEELRLELENWLSQAQQAGSTAHLAAFMREQFAEQLQLEGNKGPMWNVDLEARGFSPLSADRSQPKKGEPSDTSIKSLVQDPSSSYDISGEISMRSLSGAKERTRTPPTAVGPIQRRKMAPMIAGGLAVAAIGGFALWRMRASPPAHAEADAAIPAAPAPMAAPVASNVRVHLTSSPPGATIRDGESLIGITPADLMFPRGRSAVNLSLSMTGFRPVTRGIDLAAAPDGKPVELDLVLEAEAPPPQPAAVSAPAPLPPAEAAKRPESTAPAERRSKKSRGQVVKAFE